LSEHLNMGLDIFDQLQIVFLSAFSMTIPYIIRGTLTGLLETAHCTTIDKKRDRIIQHASPV